MSAFRQAVLSVAPECLEQFTLKMKKNIKEKPSKRKSTESRSRDKSSDAHKKRMRKSSQHKSEGKNENSSAPNKELKKHAAEGEKAKTKASIKAKDRKSGRRHSLSSKSKKSRGTLGKEKVKEDSDVDMADVDLSVPLLPLTDLVKNRTALLETVFTIIKGPKLTSMLPDILKLMPLDEIKRLCHEQLDVMSSKRILHILSGTDMNSSSGTDSSDNEHLSKKQSSKEKIASAAPDHSLQANFVDSTTGETSSNPPKSMLFPSALSTARATMSGSEIPVKEIVNNNSEQDTVTTSTEPNFIYSANMAGTTSGEESEASSDPEEGEVHSSEDERKYVKTSVHNDAKEHHVDEEVLVEEVEVEEYDEDQSKFETIPSTSSKLKTRTTTRASRPIGNNSIPPAEAKSLKNEEGEDNETSEPSSQKDSSCASSQDDAADSAVSAERDPQNAHEGKSQLEILELELRARAIRSLMKAAQSGKLKPAAK